MAEDLLAECQSPLILPNDAFVFAMHQRYRFLYFVARPGDDDPAVYSYLEGEPGSKLVATSFSEFLRDVIEGEIITLNPPRLQRLRRFYGMP
jgi:hypothetical protein